MSENILAIGKKVLAKIGKWIGIVVLSLALLALIGYIVLDNYLDSYLRSKLTEKVRKSSDGLYSLKMDKLHFSLDDFSLLATDIRFTTDSSQYQALKQKKDIPPNLYHITADSLYVSHISVWPLLWGKAINIPTIQVVEPAIQVVAHPDTSKSNQKKPVLLNLHEKIEKYVSWLTVDSFDVTNGEVTYVHKSDSGQTTFRAKNFNLSFTDVLIDEESEEDTNRVLYSKNIALLVSDGIVVKNNIYALTTGTINASTAKGTFVQHIKVATDSAALGPNSQHLFVDMNIPSLVVGYLDWRKIIDKQGLFTPAIHLSQPYVQVVADKQNQKNQQQGLKRLHRQINQWVPWLKADSILLERGQVKYVVQQNYNPQQVVEINDFNLVFDDVWIDSVAATDKNRVFYSKDIRLAIKDYVKVVDSLYTVKVGHFEASTANGITAKDINLSTRQEALKRVAPATVYEVFIPAASIAFTNWDAFLEKEGISIPTISVSNPSIRVVKNRQQKNGTSHSTPLHQVVNQYVPWLKIGQLEVNKGNIAYINRKQKSTQRFVLDKVSLTVNDVLVDSAAFHDESRTLYAKHIRAVVKDYAKAVDKYHTLRIGYAQASTSDGITVRNVRVQTDLAVLTKEKSNPAVSGSIAYLYTSFTDWGALMEGEAIHTPHLVIHKPDIKLILPSSPEKGSNKHQKNKGSNSTKGLLALHQKISPYFPKVAIDSILVEKGDIAIIQQSKGNPKEYIAEHVNLTLDDVVIDEEAARDTSRVIYSKRIKLVVKDYARYSDQEHILTVDSLYASTEEGIKATFVKLNPKPTVLAGKRKNPVYDVTVPAFTTNFTDWHSLFHGKGVRVPAIIVSNPLIKVIAANTSTKKPASNKKPHENQNQAKWTFHRTLNQYIPWLAIDSIHVARGTFHYFNKPQKQLQFAYGANEFYLTFDNVLIDSAAAFDKSRVLYTQDIRLELNDYQRNLSDSLYTLSVSHLKIATAENKLLIDTLSLDSRYPIKKFYRMAGGRKTVINVLIPTLTSHGINYDAFIKNRSIIADDMILDGMNLSVFFDYRIISDKKNPRLPLEVFRQMETYVRVDSISLVNSYIKYSQAIEKSEQPGVIFFSDIDAKVSNVTNDSTYVSLENPTVVEANGMIMGAGAASLKMKIPLFNETNAFQYTGALGQMDLTKLNPMLEHAAFMRIKSGVLDELTVQADANKDKATGIMCAFYRDFEVELLSPGEKDKNNFWQDIWTFLANNLIIGDSNRRKAWDFNPGYIEYNKEEERTIFNYFWLTLRSGIYSSVGYKKAKKVLPVL